MTIFSRKLVAVATLAALASPAAFATVTDWGTHDPVEIGTGVVSPGSFTDYFTFLYPEPGGGLGSTTVANNLTVTLGGSSFDLLHIVDGAVSLYSGIWNGANSLISTYSYDGTTGNTSVNFGPLAAGNYFYKVTGMATGSSGGSYLLTSGIVPLPEPETYAMLGVGLTALLLRLRKRRQG